MDPVTGWETEASLGGTYGVGPGEGEPVTADFWFDPACPWAWVTSRWMKQVETVRPVRVRWNVMSLAVLNENRLEELSENYRRGLREARGPVRVCVAVAADHGPQALDRLYTELGTRRHDEGRKLDRDTVREALKAAGLPVELADEADSTDRDEEVRASHDRGIGLVGQDVGTPVIAVPGPEGEPVAFFGPVVTPMPRGEAAGRLWDGVLLVAGTPGFYELKRSRTERPRID
ncbi:mycothiol-dependent nitroreductase Rv2466c family protein [Streptomyces alkaliphilus]|uniref:mycothiol-dependent nitroreductase Rv2466c family protein n=1 Tax=Streptomyces alkaliphilus TaxID=1472722 RepID=UPI00117D4FB0|nr:DsbA family protein [Streptomyces alkaliphilus]MQS07899.1 disulfide bond formation protein DsbA [Streptomyces alkaliphilus]